MNSNYGVPYDYDYINAVNGMYTPSEVHLQDNFMSRFFAKYLMQKAFSVYKWNMPEHWISEYVLYSLYTYGFFAVINTNTFGVIPQHCSLRGRGVMYQPTNAVIANPLLNGILEPTIDKQCTVIKMQPGYGGINDLVAHYAGLMATANQTALMNLINSKLSYVGFADTKTKAETLKKLFDDIYSGLPAVVIDPAVKKTRDGVDTNPWQMFNQNVGQNYIVGDIIEDLRKWENKFLTDIGIPNANTDKKERLIVSEVEANNQETQTLSEMWLEELQKGCKKASAMFNIEVSVDWRIKPTTEEPKKPKEVEA